MRSDLIALTVPGVLSDTAKRELKKSLQEIQEEWKLKYPIVILEQGAYMTNVSPLLEVYEEVKYDKPQA